MMNDDEPVDVLDLARVRADVHRWIDEVLADESPAVRGRMHEKADNAINCRLLPMLERQAGSSATH